MVFVMPADLLTLIDTLHLPIGDIMALAWFLAAWVGYTYFAVWHGRRAPNSLINVMYRYRLSWMREMLKRDNRMMDASMMGNLQRSIAFFANTTIFILLALMTLFGFRDKGVQLLETIPFASPTSPFLWEIKILLLVVIFIYAFFKCTWSLRQYNYACIIVGGAPKPTEKLEHHGDYAIRGANLIHNASQHFNLGLRAYYFGLAAFSWFAHIAIFALTTAGVVYILYRREFRSATLRNLAEVTVHQEL